MPPDDPLSKNEIALFKAWIKSGMEWPASSETLEPTTMAERVDVHVQQHWAYQPVREPRVVEPRVVDEAMYPSWSRRQLDSFVLDKLTEHGIEPSPPADRRTLIRRLSFDLTGLPPSPAATDAFVEDVNPDAYEALVDRLLSSPLYGERWGRHWLCLLYTSPSPRDATLSRMPSSA